MLTHGLRIQLEQQIPQFASLNFSGLSSWNSIDDKNVVNTCIESPPQCLILIKRANKGLHIEVRPRHDASPNLLDTGGAPNAAHGSIIDAAARAQRLFDIYRRTLISATIDHIVCSS